jgi:glycosyltransferase involved in cell wall biosynthesis
MTAIAIFHENFAQSGGAERVAESMARLLPEADVFSTLTVYKRLSPYMQGRGITNTWMQHLPGLDRLYRHYFVLYPFAVRSVNLERYRLVFSSCFGFAKGLRSETSAVHICYCHTPPRWLWRCNDYMERERFNPITRVALRALLHAMRFWDLRSSRRPDVFIANSGAVAERIFRFYGREAVILHPPVEVERFHISERIEDYYLVVSRLVGYKRIDLAIRACNHLERPLTIIGNGPDRERLQNIAGRTIRFLGRRSDEEVADHLSRCKALIFAGEEDFGIVPLEAAASGRPVIAFGSGGALETVIDGITGILFDQPTKESLANAILQLESKRWDAHILRAHAETFRTEVFHSRLRDLLLSILESRGDTELLHQIAGTERVPIAYDQALSNEACASMPTCWHSVPTLPSSSLTHNGPGG